MSQMIAGERGVSLRALVTPTEGGIASAYSSRRPAGTLGINTVGAFDLAVQCGVNLQV